MKRNCARARRLLVVNLWLGLIIDWIFSLYPSDMLSPTCPLVHLSSLSMLLFPFATIHSSLFLSRRRARHSLSHPLSLSPPDFFFSLLSSFRARSPSRASPYPPFLLAQLTKMGPAASGSRFPRKLSSYKINYPPYFIAPRRFWAVDVNARSPSFFSRFLFPRRQDEFLTNWIALRTEMRISAWSRPFSNRSSKNDSPEKWRKIEKAKRDPLSEITSENTRDKNEGSFRTVMLPISALEKVVLSN